MEEKPLQFRSSYWEARKNEASKNGITLNMYPTLVHSLNSIQDSQDEKKNTKKLTKRTQITISISPFLPSFQPLADIKGVNDIFISNRTFLVCFGSEFGRAMVRFLASQSLHGELPRQLACRLDSQTMIIYVNNRVYLARRYARTRSEQFSESEVSFKGQSVSKCFQDSFQGAIFLSQIWAILFIIVQKFFETRGILKIGQYRSQGY